MLEEVALISAGVADPHAFQKLAGGGRLDVEAAHRLAGAKKPPGSLVLQGLPGGVVDLGAGVFFRPPARASRMTARERLPRMSILTSPAASVWSFSHWIIGSPLAQTSTGTIAADLVRHHHQPAAVQGEVAKLPFQSAGDAQDALPVARSVSPHGRGDGSPPPAAVWSAFQ